MSGLPRPQSSDPDEIFAALTSLIDELERLIGRKFTTATKPAAASVRVGTVIFVTDGAPGSVVQYSNGLAWVNLG